MQVPDVPTPHTVKRNAGRIPLSVAREIVRSAEREVSRRELEGRMSLGERRKAARKRARQARRINRV